MNAIRLLPVLIGEVLKNPRSTKDRVIRVLVRDIMDGRMASVFIIAITHLFTSYLGFALLGEAHLVANASSWLYYYVTTASTVGYGDLSPNTERGRLFFTVWVAPGSIAVFAFVLTKLLGSLALLIRKFMSGLGDFSNATDHFVIIGYVPSVTERLLFETKHAREGNDTVVVTTQDTLPLPDSISRVRATSLHSREDFLRAGIKGARKVVIITGDDNQTTSACLAINAINSSARIVAFFDDEEQRALVEPSCGANFTFLVSSNVYQISREVVDPGTGEVLAQLSSTAIGATVGTIDYQGPDTTVSALRDRLEAKGANLLGYRLDDQTTPVLTFNGDTRIGREHTLIYVATERLDISSFETA